MKKICILVVGMLMVVSPAFSQRLSKSEKRLLTLTDTLMRVLKIDDFQDSLILRSKSADIRKKDIGSDIFDELSKRLLATVRDPENPGVGIAGPQIGLLRRVVAVKRYDKPGRPFEIFPNVRIVGTEGKLYKGPEGCLSVPGRRGDVPRYHHITITYTDPKSLETVREIVQGYTAIIFQHEIDHLDGILYIDKL